MALYCGDSRSREASGYKEMKIRVSYFYQIRNFTRNMIPMSTAMFDPKWYHDFKGKYYLFKDKRGILNGLRYEYIIVQDKCPHLCPCEKRQPDSCAFLRAYREELEKLDFNQVMENLSSFCAIYAREEGLDDEPIAVLIVHEAPNNPCSERRVLIDYFNAHGVECKELDYPIK